MKAKFRIGERVKIVNHPDKSKIGKEVEIINLHHSNFNKEMNKNILVKKEKPFCQLKKLPGVKKYKVDAYWINDTSDIEPTLELGYACTSSGNNGAINIWKDDTGMIRSELMRHLVVVEKRTFVSYAEVEKCVSDWLKRINE